jgi:single-strand DNA-binding protein
VNKVVLSGNLGFDPDVRQTRTGKLVANFCIAVDDSFADKANTYWLRVVAWGPLAQRVQKLAKGSGVRVGGKLVIRECVVKGERRFVPEVLANRLIDDRADMDPDEDVG